MKPYLRYNFPKDCYFVDYGVEGKDMITEKQAKSLFKNQKVLIACEIPKSWLK